MLGVTYMLQFKEIKKKHLGYFYTRLPSLQILDVMNSRAVAVGWLFLTIGVIVEPCDGPGTRGCAQRSEPAGDVARRSEDLRSDAHVGGVFLCGVRATQAWMDRPARRAAVGTGFRVRDVELSGDQLLVTTSHTFY
jgi:hypothetical protein